LRSGRHSLGRVYDDDFECDGLFLLWDECLQNRRIHHVLLRINEASQVVYDFILDKILRFSLLLMLIERYLVICNPLAGASFNIKQSMISSGCCWLWSGIWCMLPLVGWNQYALEGIGTSCAPNWYR